MIRTSVRVDGVNKALKVLKGMDPDIRKQFNKDGKEILRPVTDNAKSRYPDTYLSGMGRSWQSGRIFPYTRQKAQRGVKVSVKQERNGTLLKITQLDAAASVVEFAAKGSLGRNLSNDSRGPARVMWPAFVAHADQVQAGIQELCDGVATRLTRELA
jgi:hypothetical protein